MRVFIFDAHSCFLLEIHGNLFELPCSLKVVSRDVVGEPHFTAAPILRGFKLFNNRCSFFCLMCLYCQTTADDDEVFSDGL